MRKRVCTVDIKSSEVTYNDAYLENSGGRIGEGLNTILYKIDDKLSDVAPKRFTAGENINSHTPVVLLNNKLYKLDNTNTNHQFSFIGFTKTSVTANNEVEIEDEIITLQGWNLIPNTLYLAAQNGSIQTANNTNKD